MHPQCADFFWRILITLILTNQQECEELAQKVSDLTTCNDTLRSELEQLKKDCKAMEAENKQLMVNTTCRLYLPFPMPLGGEVFIIFVTQS